ACLTSPSAWISCGASVAWTSGEMIGTRLKTVCPSLTGWPGIGTPAPAPSGALTTPLNGEATVISPPEGTSTTPPQVLVRGTGLRSTSARPRPSRVSASGVSVTVASSASLTAAETLEGAAAFAGADADAGAAGLLGGAHPAGPMHASAI